MVVRSQRSDEIEEEESTVKARLFAVAAAVSAVSLVPAAAGIAGPNGTAAPRTTEPTDWIDIRVTITDTRIRLSRRRLP